MVGVFPQAHHYTNKKGVRMVKLSWETPYKSHAPLRCDADRFEEDMLVRGRAEV